MLIIKNAVFFVSEASKGLQAKNRLAKEKGATHRIACRLLGKKGVI